MAAIKDRNLALVIGNIMRWGVIVSISLAFIGGVIYLFRHGDEVTNFSHYTENDQTILQFLKSTFDGVVHFKGRAIITLGILLLFGTPIVRVLFSLVGFIFEKDKLYIMITLIVLMVIIISISGGLH
jgi:uncharacterized membrane protein